MSDDLVHGLLSTRRLLVMCCNEGLLIVRLRTPSALHRDPRGRRCQPWLQISGPSYHLAMLCLCVLADLLFVPDVSEVITLADAAA